MTSIIPSPGTAPTSATIDDTVFLTGTDLVIGADEVLYTPSFTERNIFYYNPSYGQPAVWVERADGTPVNNGTIWIQSSNESTTGVQIYQFASGFENNGTIVAQVLSADQYAVGGNAIGVLAEGGLVNTGEIYAFGIYSGFGVYSDDGQATYTNSGLVAAQGQLRGFAGDGNTYGFYLYNGGKFTNTAEGTILAEGPWAFGVYVSRGGFPAGGGAPEITNAGLIHAVSTEPNSPSVGIYATHTQVESMRIVNSGTVTADRAIWCPSDTFSPSQHAVETVTNESGGVLNGDIILDLGDDVLTNRGTINGDVLMGGDNDTFDTSAGSFVGLADMGLGNDTFIGSSGSDAVLGARGDDVLEGRGGADLIIAGRGDDTVIGGAGNDGLYGEYGADRIVTKGGDSVFGGAGNDRIELGDLNFAFVDGGAGIDTLVMPSGAMLFDLHLILTSGRVSGIEAIALSGSQGLVVTAADAQQMSSTGGSAKVQGGSGDTVHLVGEWSEMTGQTVDGVSYRAFSTGSTTMLVQSGVGVDLEVTPPSGAVGLSPVDGGPAAPLPGSVDGAVLTGNNYVVAGFDVTSSLVIEQDEDWSSPAGEAVITCWDSDATIVNYGDVHSTAAGDYTTYTVAIGNLAMFTNYGLISAYSAGLGDAVSYYVDAYGPMDNHGTIEAYSYGGMAAGILTADSGFNDAPSIVNSGEIFAYSETDFAVGIFSLNYTSIINDGEITAAGGMDAIAVDLGNIGSTFVNNGSVLAATSADGNASIGVYYFLNDPTTLTNTGTIEADVAVLVHTHYLSNQLFTLENTGQIMGLVIMDGEPSNDTINNKGSIDGAIFLGEGADVYKGGGLQYGGVFGEGGSDKLTGGGAQDEFWGGDGNDILDGGGGDDILLGEAGNDNLSGGDGHDELRGGSGVDVLNGGAGADMMAGGLGGDSYQVDNIGDLIIEFLGEGVDTVQASVSSTLAANVENLTLLGAASSGTGNELANIITGNERNNTLRGEDGNDSLNGGGGDDKLVGGLGADVLDGGAGIDTAGYGEKTTSVVVTLTAGDAVVTIGAVAEDTLRNIENVNGGNAADILTGNALANQLLGGNGDDLLKGGLGADILDGGAGIDTADYTDKTAAVAVTLAGAANAQVTVGGVAEDTLRNVENLIGGTAGDSLTGDSLANRLFGRQGADTLAGGGGNDFLDGGGGADLMEGGAGDDVFIVDNAADVVTEFAGEGSDRVESALSWTLSVNVETLVLTGSAIINGTGNASANTLIGNASANVLIGGGGDDTLQGGGGKDRLDGGAGIDSMSGGIGDDIYVLGGSSDLVIENANEGIDTVETNLNYTLTANLEKLVLTGVDNLKGTGNELSNTLTGNDGANVLSGLAGKDWLYGGAGADALYGGEGNDTLQGGSGADRFYGEGGTDRFIFDEPDMAGLTSDACDRIMDFSHAQGDLIGLSDIDADVSTGGDQAFAFIGSAAFSNTAGQLRYEQSGDITLITGDTNGDGVADFMIRLNGVHMLIAGDFIL